MTATLDSISEQLARLEAALADGAAVPVRTLSISRVCEITGIPRAAVLAATRTGDLPSVWVGDRTRVIRPEDLDQWLAARERAGA